MYVEGVDTDYCRNRQVCSIKYWETHTHNTREYKGRGVCDHGEIDASARVKIHT